MARWSPSHFSSSGSRARNLLKALLFVIAAAILGYQIFTIALADNGDFPRVAGRLALCPETGWDRDRFTYPIPEYVYRPACYWGSHVPTAAVLVARAVRALDPGPVCVESCFLAIFAWLLKNPGLCACRAPLPRYRLHRLLQFLLSPGRFAHRAAGYGGRRYSQERDGFHAGRAGPGDIKDPARMAGDSTFRLRHPRFPSAHISIGSAAILIGAEFG
ncbi:MAG: hypothetical protein JWO80_210 [Bryobacterales bacterium]|nr:hypothetical protein [Bryobacterales bacterium]